MAISSNLDDDWGRKWAAAKNMTTGGGPNRTSARNGITFNIFNDRETMIQQQALNHCILMQESPTPYLYMFSTLVRTNHCHRDINYNNNTLPDEDFALVSRGNN